MNTNVFEPIEFDSIRVGDVVHVLWEDVGRSLLYLNEEITEVHAADVGSEKRLFLHHVCKFYLVSKAKKPLPTELGAVVEHYDGWKFVRVGEDDWVGIDPDGDRSAVRWRNSNVDCSARKVEA